MSEDTPPEETGARRRRRRLRARGQIARTPPPRTDDRPRAWPRRLVALLVLGGVGYAGWSQRARVVSLWGSARSRVTGLVRGLMNSDPPEFTEDMVVDVPDTFAEVPVASEPPTDWTDPDSVPPDLAPLPGPPGYTPPEPSAPPPDRYPDPTEPPPDRYPDPPPSKPPPPTQLASATPTDPGPPPPTEPAGPGWRARAGDLWTQAKRGWTALGGKIAEGSEAAKVQWAKLMGDGAPTPEPSPTLPALDPDYDPFAVTDTPTPSASPTTAPSPEPTQVAVVDPLAVVHGPDWVAPVDPVKPVDPTPVATTDPWAQTPAATRDPWAPAPTTTPTRRPQPAASSWTARLAGSDGQRVTLASGVRLDLHPYTRYRRVGDEMVLLSGGALVRFPAKGGSLRLTGGLRLRGKDQLFEVGGVESGGSVDALTSGLALEWSGREPVIMKALERRYFDEDLAEPVPLAQAGTFVRRLAWFDAHPRRDQAAARALELAQGLLEDTQGTSREHAAQEAVSAAIAWAERVAMRHQRELTARL